MGWAPLPFWALVLGLSLSYSYSRPISKGFSKLFRLLSSILDENKFPLKMLFLNQITSFLLREECWVNIENLLVNKGMLRCY